MKYHVNAAGEAGVCRAENGNCPFGSDEQHYPTAEAARAAYEDTTTKKKGLFSRLTARRGKAKKTDAVDSDVHGGLEDAKVEAVVWKPRNSPTADMKKFKALLAIGKREGWNRMPDGTPFRANGMYGNTFNALQDLIKSDNLGGDAFERADRLQEAYAEKRKVGEVEAPSIGVSELTRDSYLHMVAPATAASVDAVTSSLKKAGWDVVGDKSREDQYFRSLGKLVTLDLESESGKKEAIELLNANGWEVFDDDTDALHEAAIKGREAAGEFNEFFEEEQKHLF